MSKRLRCPNCKNDGEDETIVGDIATKGAWSFIAKRISDDGDIVVEGLQHDSEPSSTMVNLICGECRHQWRMRRYPVDEGGAYDV